MREVAATSGGVGNEAEEYRAYNTKGRSGNEATLSLKGE